jgi:NAD(P)-dependent dehydrogenase (short-subunit alcohol dehydrogenase family)
VEQDLQHAESGRTIMNKADIRGKWALVTGASRGVGRQVSLGLAGYGCNLVLHSRDMAHTKSLAAELTAKGVQVRQVAAELSDQGQVDAMLNSALATGPGIDIVYNNAAVNVAFRNDWTNIPADDFRKSFEINVISLIRICHRLIPGMVQRKWGRIINVTSGVRNQPEMIAYAVSKAAVDKFVADTAGHLKEAGVLINLLDPGWLRTDLGGPQAPNAVESVLPGALVPVLIDDGTTGQLFRAQDYAGKTI